MRCCILALLLIDPHSLGLLYLHHLHAYHLLLTQMSLCSPPLIETYREGAVCPSYACLYSSVLQKPVNVRLMSRTVSGNEFQTEGPEAAKLRDPYRANRVRGIVRS